MTGGIIEGIKKCYTGNNVYIKHIFLIILSMLIVVPSVIATINTHDGQDQNIYAYIFVGFPLLGCVAMLANIVLGYYIAQFTRNTLKFLFWKESQNDEEKIKALQIMPEINAAIFNKIFHWLAFGITWCIYIGIICLALCFLILIIPEGAKLIAGLFLLLFIVISCISMPYVLCGFVKDFNLKKHLNPLLLFTYLPKIFIPAVLLDLKLLGIGLLNSIVIIVLTVIISMFFIILGSLVGFNMENLADNIAFITFLATIFTYIGTILGLAYYYAAGNIYYKYIEKTPENL